jgi:type II secretion system protein N
MSKIKKWIGYAIFIIAATAFFLYYLFPSETAEKYIAISLRKTNPDLNITINQIKPTFPPGLRFRDVSLYYLNNPLLDAELIKVTPKIISLIRPKTTFFFKGKAYKGITQGKVDIFRINPAGRIMIEAVLTGIQIKDIHAIQNLSDYKISGILAGKVSYSNNKGKDLNISADLNITDSKVDFATPIFSFDSITFRSIKANMIFNNMRLKIKECIIKGYQIDASISGLVTKRNPLGESILNLTGTINPHPPLITNLGKGFTEILFPKKKSGKSGFSFRIGGTFDKPSFSWR